jgi:hypothetical protein
MTVIDFNTIHLEDRSDFFDQIGTTCLYTILLHHFVNVVGLDLVHVNDFRVLIESLEVEPLDIKIGVFLLFLLWNNEDAFIDTLNRSNKYLRQKILSQCEHKNLLILKVVAQLDSD